MEQAVPSWPSTLPLGTQIGDSLCERRVGGKIIACDADALHRGPLSELLQKALPSQCVAASGSDKSHGKYIRLEFVAPGISTTQELLPRLAQPGAGGVPAGGLPQQKRKSGVFDDSINGVPPHDMRHFMGDQECDLVPLPLAHFQ